MDTIAIESAVNPRKFDNSRRVIYPSGELRPLKHLKRGCTNLVSAKLTVDRSVWNNWARTYDGRLIYDRINEPW